jgi:thymidylate synthase (FAD)
MPRTFSPALDAAIDNEPVKMLDHGFIRVVNYCGIEEDIERAARQSYAADPQVRTPEERRTLLRYMLRHRHNTPFEMCDLTIQAKLPIFVARQWIRHRTASVSELSGRYSILDSEFYIPELAQMCAQSATNKQGRAEVLDKTDASDIRGLMDEHGATAFGLYKYLLEDGPDGYALSRELARINLPLSTYTTWTWKVNLHNLLHFLGLRLDPHAQYEIRVYADQLWKWVSAWCPVVAEAFIDYRLESMTLSRLEVEALRKLYAHTSRDQLGVALENAQITMSSRERVEFMDKLAKLR